MAVSQSEEDAELVARCRRGDQRAWTALVQRYQRLVYAIARRAGLPDDAAADVFQTVFARLVQHLARIAEPSRLQAWVVTTAKREALLQRRLGQRTTSLTRDGGAGSEEWEVVDETPAAEATLEALQQLNLVRGAVEVLDERCRTLLLMLFSNSGEKLSYDEVAQRLGAPLGSIGPTRSRCLDKLRRSLSERAG